MNPIANPVGVTLPSADRLARLFYELCAAAGAVVLAMTALSAAGALALKGAVASLYWALVFRLGIVAPVGVASVIVLVMALRRPVRGAGFAASPWIVRGLAVSAALAFLATEVGKLAHQPEMRAFFTASGYPAWFLYVIIALETAGAVGLLVPTVRSVAACGLAVIMVGAIVTHARNGDPFSDSYEAAHLLVILVCIVLLGLLQDREALGRTRLSE
jgi:uncharacterized membrane protein YphA (DoxX/SURF4 family)